MPYRIVRHRKAPGEFYHLPPRVRAIHERAIRRMTRDPFASGVDYVVSQLSPPQGIVRPLWAMKVNGYRMFFIVDGRVVKIGGFGERPGFYRKLARVKEMLRG